MSNSENIFTKDSIIEIMHEFEKSNLAKMCITDKDLSLCMKKATAYTSNTSIVAQPLPAPSQPVGVTQASGSANEEAQSPYTEITTPIVGTYYAAPSPDSKPYVKVGDRIKEGDVVALVEAMKMMNEIKATCTGVVKKILVTNEDVVSFGQALIEVEEA